MYFVKEATYPEWQEHMQNCHKINMLQFWEYGDAKVESSRWSVYRFLIMNDDANPVGWAQVLSLNIPLIGGIARMNRGPVLIGSPEDNNEIKVLHKVISALIKEFKQRKWWLVQIAPQINDSEQTDEFLKNIGLKKIIAVPYSSGLISLQPDKEQLIMSLKKKWRYSLRKSKGLGVNVNKLVGSKNDYEILLRRYRALQSENQFNGISESLITSLSKRKAKGWEVNLFTANKGDSLNTENCYGMLVSVHHGETATYFIGITSDDGRELQVNYLLLWQAMLHAKSSGCKWFDIGGLDATTPKGIAHFKTGLKAEPYTLIGEWRGFILPWKQY